MVNIVEVRHRCSQPLYASGRAVLAPCHADIDLLGSLEGALDPILDLRGALAQVCPLLRLLGEAMFVGAFGTPDDAGRGTGRIETGVGFVAFVGIAKLPVDLGVCFCASC